jgi:glycosyltransferase involved in cell wall biosynthesis
MKIIHITNYFMPELGYQEYYLAKYHAEMGHEVHIITSDKAYPKQSDYSVLNEIYPKRKLTTGDFITENFIVHRLSSSVEFNMQLLLRGIIRKIDFISPDTIYMHGFTRFETLHISLWKKLSKKPFILVVDDHMQLSAYFERGYRKLYYAIFNFFLSKFRLFEAMDRVVAISEETKRYLESIFSLPDNKISIINLGVDREKFAYSSIDRVNQRKLLGIPRDAFLIIYAGKIIPPKKCDMVYSIAKEYLKSNPKVFLLFVGSGIDTDYAQEIKKMARNDGVENKIIWHPHIPHNELPKYFSAADTAIWPYQETMAALEAASCSLPIILRDSTIAKEYVSNNNGFACSSLEHQKKALGLLIDDPLMRHTMAGRGVELIEKKYDWKVIAKLFIDVTSS